MPNNNNNNNTTTTTGQPRDWRPIPDPTLLTNELVEKAIIGLESKLETRFNAMDKASQLLHDDYVRVPTEMDRQISHLRELMEAKIETVMALAAQRAQAAEVAVKAALDAAKEAVAQQNNANATAIGKSEVNTAETLRTLRDLFTSEIKAITAKVDDLRMTRDLHAGSEKTTDTSMARTLSIAAIVVAAGVGIAQWIAHSQLATQPTIEPRELSALESRITALSHRLDTIKP